MTKDEGPITKDQPSGGLATLARRMRGVTSNLLATAIVLVVGLVCLRQVWHWWQEDKPPTATTATNPLPTNFAGSSLPASLTQPLTLQTNSGDFTARQLSGSQAAVLSALQEECKSQLSVPPLESPVTGQREQHFLATTGEMNLVASGPNWQIYECKAEWPLVALVREIPAETASSASPQRYVAHIAFALPAGPNSWMQYSVRLSKVEL